MHFDFFLSLILSLFTELLSGIKKESELGTLPVNIASAMEELYQNYRNAVIYILDLFYILDISLNPFDKFYDTSLY